MMEELYKTFFFLEKLRSKLRRGFSDEASTHDFFWTKSDLSFLFPFRSHFLSLNGLFINGKTALTATIYFHFLVYEEKIIYQSPIYQRNMIHCTGQ